MRKYLNCVDCVAYFAFKRLERIGIATAKNTKKNHTTD